MADKCHMCLLGLIILCLHLKVSSSNSEKKSSQTMTAAPTKQKKQNSQTTQTFKTTSAAHTAVNTTQQDTTQNSLKKDLTTPIPVSSSNFEKKSSQTMTAAPTKQEKLNSWITQTLKTTSAAHTAVNTTQQVIGFVVAAVLAVLFPAVILCVICKKRADNRRGTNDSVFTDKNNRNTGTISSSIPLTPSDNEQKDDETYIEVTAYCKIQDKKTEVYDDDDKVTYSSIRGATVGPQDDCSQLYASVNKNHHK